MGTKTTLLLKPRYFHQWYTGGYIIMNFTVSEKKRHDPESRLYRTKNMSTYSVAKNCQNIIRTKRQCDTV
jgi:hypothetical protein